MLRRPPEVRVFCTKECIFPWNVEIFALNLSFSLKMPYHALVVMSTI